MKKIAIIGAGMAGITAARTLKQAGFDVSVFEKSSRPSGRMSALSTPLGSFDQGAQYFTVRDPRFLQALRDVPGTMELVRAWSATAVRVLDARGRVLEASNPPQEPHFVAQPTMGALVEHWAQPLVQDEQIVFGAQVHSIQTDQINPKLWQLKLENKVDCVASGFDGVILSIPAPQAKRLIENSTATVYNSGLLKSFNNVKMGPCWTMMVAFAQAPQLAYLGPQWNAAKSIHHRIAHSRKIPPPESVRGKNHAGSDPLTGSHPAPVRPCAPAGKTWQFARGLDRRAFWRCPRAVTP